MKLGNENTERAQSLTWWHKPVIPALRKTEAGWVQSQSELNREALSLKRRKGRGGEGRERISQDNSLLGFTYRGLISLSLHGASLGPTNSVLFKIYGKIEFLSHPPSLPPFIPFQEIRGKYNSYQSFSLTIHKYQKGCFAPKMIGCEQTEPKSPFTNTLWASLIKALGTCLPHSLQAHGVCNWWRSCRYPHASKYITKAAACLYMILGRHMQFGLSWMYLWSQDPGSRGRRIRISRPSLVI